VKVTKKEKDKVKDKVKVNKKWKVRSRVALARTAKVEHKENRSSDL